MCMLVFTVLLLFHGKMNPYMGRQLCVLKQGVALHLQICQDQGNRSQHAIRLVSFTSYMNIVACDLVYRNLSHAEVFYLAKLV